MNGSDLYVGTEWGDSGDDEEPSEFLERIPSAVWQIAAGHAEGSFPSDPNPEEATRDEFLARAPALGLSAGDTARLREFSRDAVSSSRILPRDTRRVHDMLRFRLLRQCVACDGAGTIDALADALDAERAAGGKHCPLPSAAPARAPSLTASPFACPLDAFIRVLVHIHFSVGMARPPLPASPPRRLLATQHHLPPPPADARRPSTHPQWPHRCPRGTSSAPLSWGPGAWACVSAARPAGAGHSSTSHLHLSRLASLKPRNTYPAKKCSRQVEKLTSE